MERSRSGISEFAVELVRDDRPHGPGYLYEVTRGGAVFCYGWGWGDEHQARQEALTHARRELKRRRKREAAEALGCTVEQAVQLRNGNWAAR